MSDSETEGPRRSQRARKQAKPFQSADGPSVGGKRKRGQATDDERDSVPSDDQDSPNESEPDDNEEFISKTTKSKASTRPTKKVASGKGTTAARKTGQAQVSTAATTKPKTTAPRRARKAANASEAAAGGAELGKELHLASDNPLFNTLLNPSAALQSTVDDLCESLQQTPEAALAEIINCILRACGCNESVDSDSVVDWDGVVDALDNFTESLKQEDIPIYPLTSKLPVFKKFRKSLSELLSRFITSAAQMGLLYTTDVMQALTTWVVAMSSSQIRSFRHTASVIALEIETALCSVAAAVEKEADTVHRQRGGEAKRKGKANTAREKDFEAKAAEIRERRESLGEWLGTFFDGVFVHRYRDLDPAIRTECVHAIGRWFEKYPGHFLTLNYMQYVGWVLNDASTPVRHAAVQALESAYKKTDHHTIVSGFTERHKSRYVEMARQDAELNIRTAIIKILAIVHESVTLEEDERTELCLLVFDEEPKVRAAVAGFVHGVWEEEKEERLVGRDLSEQETAWVGAKTLASSVVQWSKALQRAENEEEEDESQASSSNHLTTDFTLAIRDVVHQARIPLIVEALWDEVDVVADWHALLEFLLLDHSAENEAAPASGRRRKGKKASAAASEPVDAAWRLEDIEEGVLLEVLVTSIRYISEDAANLKKGEVDPMPEVTRALMKAFPQLFLRYQSDAKRILQVLQIPQLINLDMYLEMRMVTAYTTLWADVAKQFLSHSSQEVLDQAAATLTHLMSITSLSNANKEKMQELEDELATSLRDLIAGRDELDMISFTEDEVTNLTAICSRLCVLGGHQDITRWADEDEGGKQSSIWSIISALVERGRLGYKDEEMMVLAALRFMNLHLMWKTTLIRDESSPQAQDCAYRETFLQERSALVAKITEFAFGTRSNTAEGVKDEAFRTLIALHVLFVDADSGIDDEMESLTLTLDEEAQHRCAGFVQAQIERFTEHLQELTPQDDAQGSNSGSSTEGEGGTATRRKRPKRGTADGDEARNPSRSDLQQEYTFIKLVASFLQGIYAGAIDIRHSTALLMHYGRLGLAFDHCCKSLVEVLRDEGLYQSNGGKVAEIICHALTDSCKLLLDGVEGSIEHTVALAKALAPCFVLRGAQLAIVRRLDSEHVLHVHKTLISWTGKRLSAFESSKNKAARNNAASFFKALTGLIVVNLDGREALNIKAHMDQVLAQAKVEISATSKIWDGYRAYEKKLTSAASKDKGKKGRSKGKSAAAVTTDEDRDSEHEERVPKPKATPKARPRRSAAKARVSDIDDDDGPEEPPAAKAKPTPKPRPRRSTRRSPAAEESAPEDIDEEDDQGAPSTPRASTKQSTNGRRQPVPHAHSLPPSSPPSASSVSSGNEVDQALGNFSQIESPAGISTPLPTRKRSRASDPEPADDEDEDAIGSPVSSEASAEQGKTFKRKRRRH